MKKIAIAILVILVAVLPVSAAVQSEQNIVGETKIHTLSEPYETVCVQLSNGKEALLEKLSVAVLEKINEPSQKIFENIGVAANAMYAGDPVLGMTKFCGTLDWCNTFDEQLKVMAAFAKGYKNCGVVVIPFNCTEGEPKTDVEMLKGKFAWLIPFRSGTNFKVTLLGKKDTTAKIWKILGAKPVCKEWQGGFWEREILVHGK